MCIICILCIASESLSPSTFCMPRLADPTFGIRNQNKSLLWWSIKQFSFIRDNLRGCSQMTSAAKGGVGCPVLFDFSRWEGELGKIWRLLTKLIFVDIWMTLTLNIYNVEYLRGRMNKGETALYLNVQSDHFRILKEPLLWPNSFFLKKD